MNSNENGLKMAEILQEMIELELNMKKPTRDCSLVGFGYGVSSLQ